MGDSYKHSSINRRAIFRQLNEHSLFKEDSAQVSSVPTRTATAICREDPLLIKSFGFATQTVLVRSKHTNHVSQDHLNLNAEGFVRDLGHKRHISVCSVHTEILLWRVRSSTHPRKSVTSDVLFLYLSGEP
jgi:hypothetical protein